MSSSNRNEARRSTTTDLEPQVDVDPETEIQKGEWPIDQPIMAEGPEHMHVVEGDQ